MSVESIKVPVVLEDIWFIFYAIRNAIFYILHLPFIPTHSLFYCFPAPTSTIFSSCFKQTLPKFARCWVVLAKMWTFLLSTNQWLTWASMNTANIILQLQMANSLGYLSNTSAFFIRNLRPKVFNDWTCQN